MHSAVAFGTLRHRRHEPRKHAFEYAISMLYLDLSEASEVMRLHPLWSWNRRNIACVLRDDHLRHPAEDLGEAVRATIEAFSGERCEGSISLLTQPRYWGHALNPISVYFVWSPDRTRLEWLLLEVHNTPWEEQQAYVLRVPPDGYPVQLEFDKTMHVSPFMDMDMRYRLALRQPPDRSIELSLSNWRDESCLFSAHLQLDLAPVTPARLTALLLKTPCMSLKVAGAIYWEALKLKLKGIPYVPHPGRHDGKPSGVS